MKIPRRMPGTEMGVPVPVPGILLGILSREAGIQLLSDTRMPRTGTGVPVPMPGILLGREKAAIRLPSVSQSIISQQKGIQLPSNTTSYLSRMESSYPVTQHNIPAEGNPVTQ